MLKTALLLSWIDFRTEEYKCKRRNIAFVKRRSRQGKEPFYSYTSRVFLKLSLTIERTGKLALFEASAAKYRALLGYNAASSGNYADVSGQLIGPTKGQESRKD